MRRSTFLKAATGAAAVALLTSGCLGSTTSNTAATSGAAVTGDGAGGTVEIMYAFGGDQDKGFRASLDPWAKSHNITIKYNSSDQFDKLIQTRVQGGDLPNIAIFPQPGIIKGFVAKGKVVDLGTVVDIAKVKDSMVPGFLDAAAVDGKVYGIPVSANVKSLYWYDKANFAAAGLTVPKTQAELEALIEKVKASGKTPLCYGMESGGATGWPATDWIEDYVLQTGGTAVYDDWVAGKVKFSDAAIAPAFDIYEKLLLADANVLGGAKAAAANAFGTALNPMFAASNPGCFIGKQGNFITGADFFGKAGVTSANIDTKVGVFQTPSVKGQTPVLGGGDLLAVMKNDAATKAVAKYLTEDATFGAEWAKTGTMMSPHKSFNAANYPNQTIKDIAKILSSASVFRFDGSDSMPAKVGAGSFWTDMVKWQSGQQDRATTLKNIDASWPAS
jgi:alpha-glucoside transport system substrate-binding protein